MSRWDLRGAPLPPWLVILGAGTLTSLATHTARWPHRLVYRHLHLSMELTRKDEAVQLALVATRKALFYARAQVAWGGWFQLDHPAHAATVHWVMAGANVDRLVGVRHPLNPGGNADRYGLAGHERV